MKHRGWSASAIKASSTCELAFSFRMQGKKPIRMIESTHTVVGNAIHKVIEDALGQGTSVEDGFAKMTSELTSVDYRRLLSHTARVEQTVATIRRWIDVYQAKDKVLLEHALTAPDDQGDPWLIGRIDLMIPFVKGGRPAMLIMDHKTGQNQGTLPHETQLLVYAELVFSSFETVELVCPVIHYTKEGDLVRGDVIDRKDRAALRAHLRSLTEQAASVAAMTHPKPTKSHACESCGYFEESPLQTRKR